MNRAVAWNRPKSDRPADDPTPMRKWHTLALSVFVLGPVALAQSGCLIAAAAAGTAGGVMYVKGDSYETVEGTPKDVTRAAVDAAKEMELVLVSNAATSVDGKVVARTAGDAKVVVVAKRQGDNATSVSVRVGNFGDQVLQGNLLNRIKKNLKNAPATPTPDTATATADTAGE